MYLRINCTVKCKYRYMLFYIIDSILIIENIHLKKLKHQFKIFKSSFKSCSEWKIIDAGLLLNEL